MTDEFYISRHNIDRGGDQGLFDKHHDGNLRFLPASSGGAVADLSLVAGSPRGRVRHFRQGRADEDLRLWAARLPQGAALGQRLVRSQNPPRILLKCNYYIDHSGLSLWRRAGIGLNIAVFYSVKAAMEYSKSPKTIFRRRCVGMMCNVFRQLNNFSPAA